jgi:hypothetical protein
VRTTIDLPAPLFRRTKALAAVRGISLKTLIAGALEREISQEPSKSASPPKRRRPAIHLRHRATLDRTRFDFDDLFT